MKKSLAVLLALALALTLGLPALAAPSAEPSAEPAPAFDEVGDKVEFGHFTAEAIVLDRDADIAVYGVMDYTKEVPMADSYDANGVTDDNNTSSTYVVTHGAQALVIDLGNGAAATAGHFGEDAEDQAVLDGIDGEFRDLILALVDGRDFSIAITHNHGDHIGYCTALAGEGYKLYFPAGDYTEQIVEAFGDFAEMYDLETFTAGELVIDLDGVAVETINCAGHTTESTLYLLDTPIITESCDDCGEFEDEIETYYLFSGDAIGSGSSGWFFSPDSIRTFSEAIGPVYDQLAELTAGGAKLRIEGGHGWQIWNRFGDMGMDLRYIANMKTLTEKLPEGGWVEEGTDGKTLEELLQEGNLVTKATGAWLDTTIYYGEELDAVAGITTSLDTLNELAGIAE